MKDEASDTEINACHFSGRPGESGRNRTATSHRKPVENLQPFNFLPRHSYSDRFCLKPKQVLRYFEGHFVKDVLLPAIRKEAVDQSLERCKLHVPFV